MPTAEQDRAQQAHNHPDVVRPRRQMETADERSHRQVREALPPPPAGPVSSRGHGGAAQPLVPGADLSPKESYPGTDFHAPGFRPNWREATLGTLESADKLAGAALGVRPSRMPGNILEGAGVGTLGLPRDAPGGFRGSNELRDQLTRRAIAGDKQAQSELESRSQPSVGIVPWGIFGKGINAELGAARTATRAAKATKRSERIAAEVDQSLQTSPVRQAAHDHFDATAANPQEASVLKAQWDAQAHAIARATKGRKGLNEFKQRMATFHVYPDQQVAANLRSRMNPRNAGRGIQMNPRVKQGGQHVLGPITPAAWAKRVGSVMPHAEIHQWANWYPEVYPLFKRVFGNDADAILRGFSASQANASPTSGLEATLRVLDKLRRGETPASNEISAVVDSITAAVKGTPVEKGIAAKLSDFIDSLRGLDTRTWMGHAAEGGAPTAIDVHALRDLGYVDPKLVARLEKRGLQAGKDFVVDSPGVAKGPMYEQGVRQYQAITDHLNKIGFAGRKNWKPSEVQAVGWAAIQKFHGAEPQNLELAIARNTRTFQAPASGEELAKTATELGGYVTHAEQNLVRVVASPEKAREIGQRLADTHGDAHLLWLSNVSQARNVFLHIRGSVPVDVVEQLARHGFDRVHETTDGITLVGETRVVKSGTLDQALAEARAAGLEATAGKTQLESFHGEGQQSGSADRASGLDQAVPAAEAQGGTAAAGQDRLAQADHGYAAQAGHDLQGLPATVKFGGGDLHVHSNAEAQSLAEQYMRETGLPYDPPRTYAKVDKARAKKIADWYDHAVDAPNDPQVRAAYDAMARETLAQYKTITDAGYTFEFYPGHDPYPGGPREAMLDLQQNKHMFVFPTESGFGTPGSIVSDAPLLADSGVVWGGKAVTHNDVFRAVHDFFGHFKEGVGFRADGEENAWRAHSAMYSPEARKAMTSETRGQNSWVNFGPHGEANRTAQQAETVYADQKAVLAPDWVVNDGAHDAGRKATSDLTVSDILAQAPKEKSGLSFGDHASKVYDEHTQAALDIARLLPEDQWPSWVKNQIRTMAVGRDEPVKFPDATSPLDQNLGPTQRYKEYLAKQAAGDPLHGLSPQEWQDYQAWLDAHPGNKRIAFRGASGLNSGIPIGGNEDAALFHVNLDKPKLSPKEELQQHEIRQAAHENIDATYGDPELQKALKKAYDEQALSGAEKAGMTPGEFLQKRAEVQPDAAAKVLAGMRGDKMFSKRTAQDAGYNVERGRRAGEFGNALRANPTLQGFEEASAHLKGALPKLETNGIRGLSNEEVDSLVAHVAIHPGLREFEQKRVIDALRNAWIDGKVPTRSEYRLLHEAFGTNFAAKAFAPHVLSKYRHAVLETLNIPRSLMASFDVSAPFRQGLVAFARHPLMTGRNLGPMFRYLVSEKGYHHFMEDLRAAPDYAEMEKDGLAITDVEHSLANREEQFQSNYAEKLTGGRFSPVRGSGRAYTGFLVKTRVDMYRYLRDLADQKGHTLDEEARQQLANYINAATGRGDLGRFERDAVTLNALMFSPRLMASRLNFLDPRAYYGLDPFVRQQKIRAALQTAGAVGAVLFLASKVAGVKVSLNPTSSDFGKIRIGNTRVDVAGGFVQYIRLVSTLGVAASGHGNGKTVDAVTRFFRGKEAPVASVVTDFATHTNYAGIPLKNWKKEIYDSFIPLVAQDIRDTYNQTGSVGAAVGAAAASGTGIGVQSYGAKTRHAAKSPEQKSQDWLNQVHQAFGHVPDYVKKALTLKTQYQSDRAQFKKANSLKRLTPRQEITVKLGVLSTVDGTTSQQGLAFMQQNPRLTYKRVAAINNWLDHKLGWDELDKVSRALRAKEHAGAKY